MARPKTYKINEETFVGPLNPTTAYVLGLILSDGHLGYKRGAFGYACKVEDECLIKVILDTMCATHPIKKYKVNGRTYSRISISNVKLVRGLIEKFNLPKSNKSLNNLFIPKNIPEELMPHFLRGFFDGDGSIWKVGKTFKCAYTGGENMMLDIKRTLLPVGITSTLVYRFGKKNKNSCSLVISTHENISKLHTYLYSYSDCYLIRKKNRFESHEISYDAARARNLKSNGMGKKIEMLYKQGISQKHISDSITVPYSTVRAHVQLLRKSGTLV